MFELASCTLDGSASRFEPQQNVKTSSSRIRYRIDPAGQRYLLHNPPKEEILVLRSSACTFDYPLKSVRICPSQMIACSNRIKYFFLVSFHVRHIHVCLSMSWELYSHCVDAVAICRLLDGLTQSM
jgi:hypothetical protein